MRRLLLAASSLYRLAGQAAGQSESAVELLRRAGALQPSAPAELPSIGNDQTGGPPIPKPPLVTRTSGLLGSIVTVAAAPRKLPSGS